MSASPSAVRAARELAGSRAAIAGPPGRPAVAPAVAVGSPADSWAWWTPEALKGWAGNGPSLPAHTLEAPVGHAMTPRLRDEQEPPS